MKRKTPIQELKDLDEKTVYVVSNACFEVFMAQKPNFYPHPQEKNPHEQINAQIP